MSKNHCQKTSSVLLPVSGDQKNNYEITFSNTTITGQPRTTLK